MDARQIDMLVAERVMGWQLKGEPYTRWVLPDGSERILAAPEFSTDIAAAWSVVEKMRERPGAFHLVGLIGGGYRCTFSDVVEVRDIEHDEYVGLERKWLSEAIGATMPMTICLAALRAAGVAVEETQC